MSTTRDLVPQDNAHRSNANDVGAAAGADAGGTYFLGRYRVVDEIGLGGMASVHLARMDGPGGFQRWVAIKKIHAHLLEDESFVQMFLDEARVAARINHPNVVSVYDLGKHDDTYWIAMEYLHGEALREIMRRTEELGTAMPPEIACRVIADAAEGLHAAHELVGKNGEQLDLVHRDVTPHNLFVTYDGVTKVVDFGIAKFASRVSTTRAGTLKGKLAYMSPEQVQGEQIDRRTDIFALGVVLWELTTGQRLFRMENDLDTLAKVQECNVPRPSTLIRGYPIDLEKIVMKALSKNRAERFRTAREFSRALQGLLMRRGLFVASDEVSGYIRSIFQDRIAKREAHLKWASDVTQMLDVDKLDPTKAPPRAVSGAAPPVEEHIETHFDVNATPHDDVADTYNPPQSSTAALDTRALPNAPAPPHDLPRAELDSVPVPIYSEVPDASAQAPDTEEEEVDDETVVAPTRVEAPPDPTAPMHSPSFGSFASSLHPEAADGRFTPPFAPGSVPRTAPQMPSASGHYQGSGGPFLKSLTPGQVAAPAQQQPAGRLAIPTVTSLRAAGAQALQKPPPWWAIVIAMALLVVVLGTIAGWIFSSPTPVAKGGLGPFASARAAFSGVVSAPPPPPPPAPAPPTIATPPEVSPSPAAPTPPPPATNVAPEPPRPAEPAVPPAALSTAKAPSTAAPPAAAASHEIRPRGGMGALTVVCQKARCDQIVIDGQALGAGNVFARAVSAGKHTVVLSATNGVKKTMTVEVTADQTKELRVPMDR